MSTAPDPEPIAQPSAEMPVLVEMTRNGLVEGRHRGSVIAVDPNGDPVLRLGVVDQLMYPRSANKPAQAAAMVGMGLPLDGELLALACASHSGEPFHLDGARRILAEAGLDESALQNTPRWPLQGGVTRDYVRAGGVASSLSADCSGKHAAMLLTCAVNGWSQANYLEHSHPLQQGIRATIARLAGESVQHEAVDGCGAPLHALTLTGLVRLFRAVATATPDSPEGKVASAMTDHPEWVSGSTRDEARLLRELPGAVGKSGAEAVYAVALPDGRAVACKIDDGGSRASPIVLARALGLLGVDPQVLQTRERTPVLGGGDRVGELRAVF
ncbi:MAG TPA: asparaginase [Jiangellaceae bacterium]|nr:asparaginase [Jiangellaceae bacterium]